MTPHPQAEILRAIADGKTIEARTTLERATQTGDRNWIVPADVLGMIADPVVVRNWEFRIKPEIININGIEVPCPVREPLTNGQKYFLVSFGFGGARHLYWTGGSIDRHYLNHGLIHLTEEAAIAHVEALLSFTRSDK